MKFPHKILVLSLILLVLLSCRRTRWDEFDIDYSTKFVIPSELGVSTSFSIPTPDITSNSEQEFENNDTRARWVNNIQLEEIELNIESPSNRDFSFLKDIEIYINSDGNSETMLASKYDIPEDVGQRLVLNSTGNNFASHIKAEKFSLRVVHTTRQFFSQDITIRADKTFLVKNDNRLF